MVVGFLFALAMLGITGDELRFRLRARRALAIRAGDTKGQVKKVLNESSSRAAL